MKIAQIAPLYESVPPQLYGGTERVVSYLTETLVDLGHDVTLYASGDSVTKARLRPACERALRLNRESLDPTADHIYLIERIYQEAEEFDVVHSHIDYMAFPLLRRLGTPRVTTLHGLLEIANLRNLYREFYDEPLVSISNDQRQPLAWANWQATIYHGIPEGLYTYQDNPGQYLAFLGRISPEKRLDHALEIARRTGLPLKIAAKVDKMDREYFDGRIKPLLTSADAEFVGEIGDSNKNEFLGNALALLFPIDWREPFGLVMIEAMACGTPVIAFARGSVPEIVDKGVSGFVVHNIEEAVHAVQNIFQLSRRACRQAFEARFTAARMAKDYVAVYEQLQRAQPVPKLAASLVL